MTALGPLSRTRGLVPILIACAAAVPFAASAMLAPQVGVMPLLALGFLAGPAFIAAWLMCRRPVTMLVALFVSLAPIDFLLTFGGTVTVTRLVGFLAIAALVTHIIVNGSRPMLPRSVQAWGVAFLWMLASVTWAGDQPKSIERLSQTGLSLLLVVLVGLVRCDRNDLRAILVAIAGGGTAVAVYALALHPTMKSNAERIVLRGGGMTMDPNGLALALLPALAIAVAAAVTPGARGRRIIGAIMLVPLVIAIIATESRGGLLAVLALAVWLAVRARARLLVFGFGACTALIAFAQTGLFARFSDTEGAGRLPIWQVGVEAFRRHWLIGNGYGTFTDAYNQVYLTVPHHFVTGWTREAHNLPIAVFTELGIIGGSLVLYAWWRQFRELATIPDGDTDEWLRLACEAGIVSVFVAALFLDVLVLKPAWVMPLLIAAIANVRSAERSHAQTVGASTGAHRSAAGAAL